jgi:hypothetical protein
MKLKQTYNVFLDDDRDPAQCTTYSTLYMPQNKRMYTMEKWEVVRNYTDFVKLIIDRMEKGEFPLKISFDHDLADEHYAPLTKPGDPYPTEFTEKTGNEAAKWLVNQCIVEDIELPECWVHSQNPIGSKRIRETLDDYWRYVKKFK